MRRRVDEPGVMQRSHVTNDDGDKERSGQGLAPEVDREEGRKDDGEDQRERCVVSKTISKELISMSPDSSKTQSTHSLW